MIRKGIAAVIALCGLTAGSAVFLGYSQSDSPDQRTTLPDVKIVSDTSAVDQSDLARVVSFSSTIKNRLIQVGSQVAQNHASEIDDYKKMIAEFDQCLVANSETCLQERLKFYMDSDLARLKND